MRYEGIVYRPPSEANSLIIQATIGCPHNKCNFCTMYKDSKFKIRPVKEIKEDLDMAKIYYGDNVNTVFFADGNTILLKTKDLIEIFEYTARLFSNLKRITLYGSARFIVLKSLEELKALKAAGLKRIHSGMESGDDEVLKLLNKGTTPEEIIKAGRMLKEAEIQVSEYIMVGAGGRKMSRNHAINSAKVLNQINPDFIRLRTFMVLNGTPIHEMYQKGDFELLSPHEALRETKLFIEHLDGIDSNLLSDHVSNYWNIYGKLPEAKENMLKEADYALTLDQSNFRDPTECYL